MLVVRCSTARSGRQMVTAPMGARRASAPTLPRSSRQEQRAAKRLAKELEDRFGVDATMRIDERGVLWVEVKLSDRLEAA